MLYRQVHLSATGRLVDDHGTHGLLCSCQLCIVQTDRAPVHSNEYMPLLSSRLLTDVAGTDDDLENGASGFMCEMRSTAFALANAGMCSRLYRVDLLKGPGTLLLLDELGRGTSPSHGAAIAHAVSESLIKSKVPCFLVLGKLTTRPGLCYLCHALQRVVLSRRAVPQLQELSHDRNYLLALR
jgi:hypothetical protein